MITTETDVKQHLAYHGTSKVETVLQEGLLASKAGTCPHIWLARIPQDAAAFGTVIEVNLVGLPGEWPLDDDGKEEWQAAYHGGDIGPERLWLWEN